MIIKINFLKIIIVDCGEIEVAALSEETQNVIELKDNNDVTILVSPSKKGTKRKVCPAKWRRNINKCIRNEKKAYEMTFAKRKEREERKMKPSSLH